MIKRKIKKEDELNNAFSKVEKLRLELSALINDLMKKKLLSIDETK